MGIGSIESSIKGTLIILNAQTISNILEMPKISACIPKIDNKFDGLKCILERDEVGEMEYVQENQLSIEMWLLHHIISKIIFPMISQFDWVSRKDVAVMYYLI